ncbi:MAG: hypothetical protein AAF039_13010 [Bacteroidota bacterium]
MKKSIALTNEEKLIIKTLTEVDSLSVLDNGRFWGERLHGPMLFVNPETRIFYANENNQSKDFESFHSIYRDSLPSKINIANTAIDWNGKRWTMVMLPWPIDRSSRNKLILHESFHRIQPEIGFEGLYESGNAHLDAYEGRLLLKLELEALEDALTANTKEEKRHHIRNALFFRTKRQVNLDIKKGENTLELNEGLAEYTGLMLSTSNHEKIKTLLVKGKKDFYSNSTFVRSFAYHTIPIYGYILSSNRPNWHQEIDKNTNLTDYFITTFKIDFDDNLSVERTATQNNYAYKEIQREEVVREKHRLKKIAKLKAKYTAHPTLELRFQNMNISFNPQNIVPIEDLGTVYPSLRITDNWGILTVENGALLAPDWSKVTISEPIEILDNRVTGEGWLLELSEEWRVKKVDKEYVITNKQ